jgi:invasion protein IalB
MSKSLITAVLILTGASVFSNAHAAGTKADPAAARPSTQLFGDWLVACSGPAPNAKTCQMSQTLSSTRLKKTVSVLTIAKDRNGKLRGSFRLPVGVSLAQGLVVSIDSKAFNVPYSACHRVGCFAPFDLSAPMIDQLSKATKVSAVAQSTSNQNIALNFSTRGFRAAYDAYLKQLQ